MYKGNGATMAFPLPPGEDGRSVYWMTEHTATAMKEGEAYRVEGGCVVFETAPPVGVTVAFSGADIPTPFRAANVCTVIYPDGRVAEITEDPVALLAAAKIEYDKAKRLLKEAMAENERAEIAARNYAELAKEKLSSRLDKYAELVDDSVKQAAALARDEVNDHIDKKLVEIRKKHRETMSARGEIAAIVEGARESFLADFSDMRQKHLSEHETVFNNLKELRTIKQDVRELVSEARIAATEASSKVARVFGDRTNVVLEELRSLKNTLSNEVESVIKAAVREMESGLAEMRAQRAESARMMKHMNRIERFTAEARDEIRNKSGDDKAVAAAKIFEPRGGE